MTEVKFPVIVRVNGQQSYQWLTLEQANKRFVVIDNRLVIHKVEPLSLEYCQFLLEQYQRSLADSKKYFEFLCEDAHYCKNNERFIKRALFLQISEWSQHELDNVLVEIKNAEQAISFLKQAIVFLNS